MTSLAHRSPDLNRADWNALAPLPGSLVTNFDPACGFVCVTGTGKWDLAYVDAHFRELEMVILRMRANGIVRALIDLRQAAPQDPEVNDRILYWTTRLYIGRDRVAIVVASSLAKVNAKRMIDRGLTETFISIDAARTWLHAY